MFLKLYFNSLKLKNRKKGLKNNPKMNNELEINMGDLSAIEGAGRTNNTRLHSQYNNQNSVKKRSNAPYVPTYYKKVRNYEKENSKLAFTASNKNNKEIGLEVQAAGKMNKKSKPARVSQLGSTKMENRILPESMHSMAHGRSRSVISVVNNSYTQLNLDIDEKVRVNPTDPHDRNLFKESKLSYLQDDVNHLSGMSHA